MLAEGEADAPEGEERADFRFDLAFEVGTRTPATLEVYARDGQDEVGIFAVPVNLVAGEAGNQAED